MNRSCVESHGIYHHSFWQLMLAIDAAYYRNTVQIIGLSIFNALFLAWAALQVSRLLMFWPTTRTAG